MATKLDELSLLLNRIHSGELLHNQSRYYKTTDCGTAACICGWDYAIDRYKGDAATAQSVVDSSDVCLWEYSRRKYSLTRYEAALLFDENSTPELQKATLYALQQGRSLALTSSMSTPNKNKQGNGIVFVLNCVEDKLALAAFFEGTDLEYAMYGD